MSATLSSSLPNDDRNGIAGIAAALVNEPESRHVIVAVVACDKITTKVSTGDVVPTARICAIEGFPGATADGQELRRLWRRAYERRTGNVELPLEIERELDSIAPPDTDE